MFTIGYLVSSFISGRLLSLISVGTLLALSCLATGVSLVGYALAAAWPVMVTLGVTAGLGAGAIDAGLNTFAATQFSARMVNWLHACYGIGAASGPVIMTGVLSTRHPWQRGYALVGAWQVALAVCFAVTRKLWRATEASVAGRGSAIVVPRASNVSTLKLPVAWLSMAVFFVYTGIEAAAGTWAYSLFTQARGVPMMSAGTWVSIYWGSLSVGRLLSGIVAGFVPVRRLLGLCIVSIALGAALISLNAAVQLSFAGLALMGLSSAPIFPSLIAATPARLGSAHTANSIGFQIGAAVLGQSLLPGLVGVLAGKFGLEIVGPGLLVAALLLLALYQILTVTGDTSKPAREPHVVA